MKLVVGLGNPGEEYSKTRHNVGYMFLDKYYSDFTLNKKFKAMELNTKIGDENVILIKPITYMNSSGDSIGLYKNYYKVNDSDILVIHDDMDISLGDYKLSFNHGAGGHNGIKDIINNLSSKEFYRLRIGISKNDKEMKEYVLDKFGKKELTIIDETLSKLEDLVSDFVMLDKDKFMIKYNTK